MKDIKVLQHSPAKGNTQLIMVIAFFDVLIHLNLKADILNDPPNYRRDNKGHFIFELSGFINISLCALSHFIKRFISFSLPV